MSKYHRILLDVTHSGKPDYGICEVTLDGRGRITAWATTGIRLRSPSIDVLLAQLHELRGALGKHILREGQLNAQGGRHLAAR